MSTYTPDKWVVVEIASTTEKTFRVLASWYGGYCGSDSWKLSSGIVRVDEFDDHWDFHNYSGSIYTCYKTIYGTSGFTQSVYATLKGQSDELTTINMLDKDTLFNELNYA